MTCDKIRAFLPDMMFSSMHVPADVRQHFQDCPICQGEWKEMQGTMRLLDAWTAPEPSPYFDVRLAARLREEKNAAAPGWLERMRSRLLFSSNLHLRPAVAAAFALILIIGAGSYEGFVNLEKTNPAGGQTVSATVKDLELLDSNEQTLQQMAAFDDTDVGIGQAQNGGASN